MIYCSQSIPGRKVLYRVRCRVPQEYMLKFCKALRRAGYTSTTILVPSNDIESNAPPDILAWHEELIYQDYLSAILAPNELYG